MHSICSDFINVDMPMYVCTHAHNYWGGVANTGVQLRYHSLS